MIVLREAGGGKFSGLLCHLRMEHKHEADTASAVGTNRLYSVLFD